MPLTARISAIISATVIATSLFSGLGAATFSTSAGSQATVHAIADGTTAPDPGGIGWD